MTRSSLPFGPEKPEHSLTMPAKALLFEKPIARGVGSREAGAMRFGQSKGRRILILRRPARAAAGETS